MAHPLFDFDLAMSRYWEEASRPAMPGFREAVELARQRDRLRPRQ